MVAVFPIPRVLRVRAHGGLAVKQPQARRTPRGVEPAWMDGAKEGQEGVGGCVCVCVCVCVLRVCVCQRKRDRGKEGEREREMKVKEAYRGTDSEKVLEYMNAKQIRTKREGEETNEGTSA